MDYARPNKCFIEVFTKKPFGIIHYFFNRLSDDKL